MPTKLSEAQKKLLVEFENGSEPDMYQKKKSFTEIMRELFTGDDKVKTPSEKEKKKKKKK